MDRKYWKGAIGLTLAIAFAIAPCASADNGEIPARPTFYKDVMPILQENCQVCHRPSGANMGGMVAPMSFTGYSDVRPWAKAIVKQVETRSMPPWHASREFDGVFHNERTLTNAQIETLVRWVKTGAQRGNEADAPEPIQWPETKWSFDPDLIVAMPEKYFVEDDVQDLYMEFEVTITEEMLPEPRWIKSAEFKGGSEVVHHIIARPLGGTAPGLGAKTYPAGYGALLSPGEVVTFDMHYHKEAGPGTGRWDQSEVAVEFYDKDEVVTHEVRSTAVGNTWFEIPPGHPNWRVGASMTFDEDMHLLSMMPHMHLRGKDARYVAFYPDGTQEVLLDVPKYDFNWQTPYEYETPRVLPKGTRIDVVMHFDNSEANAYNPDPTKAIRFGGPTTDEMMLGWIAISEAAPKEIDSSAD